MNIVYVMHISWYWAKQRPHFLAIGLSKNHNVSIRFLKSYRKSNLKAESIENLDVKEIFVFPFGNRLKLIWLVNNLLIKIQMKQSVKNADLLWLTSPQLAFLAKNNLAKRTIYDCMDDFLEFPAIKNKEWLRKIIAASEALLISKTNAVIFSSEVLKQRILNRNNVRNSLNAHVVNNAFNLPIEFKKERSKVEGSQNIRMVYVGTISEWFDFDLLLTHVNSDKNVFYEIYGPTEVATLRHDRIRFFGPIPHSEVFTVIKNADILVMPFVVNDLIRAVNPVKLYEYIYMEKPVLAPRYEESVKFEDYVYLYESINDYTEICKKIITEGCKPKNTTQECAKFALANTWDKRIDQINSLLNPMTQQ